MARMPFQDTKVKASKSQLEIKELLYSVGFTRIAEISNQNGDTSLIAEVDSGEGQSVSFKFDVNYKTIQRKATRHMDDDRCLRVAWRIVFNQVKSLCDSVKWGVVTIPEAFGGLALIRDNTGNPVKMSDFITQGIHGGLLTSESVANKFLLSAPEGERDDNSRN